MATVKQHVDQWRHNRKFATTIDRTFIDWQINTVFYTALHAVDAAMVKLGISISDHDGRNKTVHTNASFVGVRNKYITLYRLSRVTRYDADPAAWFPKKYLTMNDLAADLLIPIEIEVEKLLGKSVSLPKLTLQT